MMKIFILVIIGLFCLLLFIVIRCILAHKACNINRRTLFVLSSIPILLYLSIMTIIFFSKKIKGLTLETSDWVAIGISFFELITECIMNHNYQPLPTVHFNELTVRRPTYDQSNTSYDTDFEFFDNNPEITGKHNLVIKEIRIYIVLIKEIFDNDNLFQIFKENQQYIRSFVITDKTCFKYDHTNQKFELTVFIKNDKRNYLTMYLKNNIDYFLDRSMVRVEIVYETYKNCIKPINCILEKLIWKTDSFKSTSNKFVAISNNGTRSNRIKYSEQQ